MAGAPAIVRTERLCKNFDTLAGAVAVLRDIDLVISRGEFVAIMGPSGSGKSTLMNILGCLDTPSSGRYLLDGRDAGTLDADQLAHLRNEVIGFVFQGYNLLPRANLVDNVALPLIYRGVDRAERTRRALLMLDKVGLAAHSASLPGAISGGEQQRVAIARALVTAPRLILADEPTGNLDSRKSAEIMQLISDLNRNEGITAIVVTHDPDVAAYAGRLVRIVDGRIQYDGAPIAHAEAVA